ncbi:MAG: DegT/DnrJ/EryC1/StrS family aminotransferase [Anaerolineae bacterium]
MAALALLGGERAAAELKPAAWPAVTDDDVKAVVEALQSGRWCRIYPGSRVEAFEAAFAAYQQAQHGVAVCNGTAALELALQAVGVRPGDEVLVPAVTFIASAGAITRVGAIPVFVDSDPERVSISPQAMERAITPRTTAVVAVHYGGYPVDLDAVRSVTRTHGLALVEDCAHAQGTEWRGKRVGALGSAGGFSFQESKALPGGEGGMVLTNDAAVAERARLLHNIGRVLGRPGYEHFVLASNYRMPELQGALLYSVLQRYPQQQQARQEAGQVLTAGLADIEGIEPLPADPRVTSRGYYFYVMRYIPEAFPGVSRARFMEALAAEGVYCGAGYGVPLYRQPAFARENIEPLYPRGTELPDYENLRLPTAERFCAEEQITLPQPLLLGGKSAGDLILRAIAKVVANIDSLR